MTYTPKQMEDPSSSADLYLDSIGAVRFDLLGGEKSPEICWRTVAGQQFECDDDGMPKRYWFKRDVSSYHFENKFRKTTYIDKDGFYLLTIPDLVSGKPYILKSTREATPQELATAYSV